MAKKLLLIYNHKAGRSTIKNSLADVTDIFTKAGYDVSIRPTQDREDAYKTALERSADYDLVVAAGGDGTIGEVAAGIYGSGLKTPIGILPCGSTNDYAVTLDLPKTLPAAARYIVSAEPHAVDFGRLNDTKFIYIAAFGWFTDVSYATDQNLKNVFGHGAYILEAGKRLFNVPEFEIKITSAQHTEKNRFIFGMVTNSISVGGMKGFAWKDIDIDDGLLEVALVRPPKNIMEASEGFTSLVSGTPSDLILRFKTDRLLIESEQKIKWTIDGEESGSFGVNEIECLHKAVNIMLNDK